MGIVDYIAIAAIVLIVGAAVFYIVCAKKHGKKCIGCPYGDSCAHKGNCISVKNKQNSKEEQD